MSKLWVLAFAFMLLLAAFPLISIGTTQDNDTLWWIGLGMLAAGGLVPPIARYAIPEEDDNGDPGEAGEDRKDEEREPGARAPERARPTAIRVERAEDVKEPEPTERESPPVGEHERLARSHELRAEAHRERALAFEELAEAEQKRASAEVEGAQRPSAAAAENEDKTQTNPHEEQR